MYKLGMENMSLFLVDRRNDKVIIDLHT